MITRAGKSVTLFLYGGVAKEIEMTIAFKYTTLTSEHAAAWQALRVIGARDFPMGFLVTVAEVQTGGVSRAAEVLDAGSVRGVFVGNDLVGFCGYRPQRLERIRHRAEIGPFFVMPDWQGRGAAYALMQGVIAEARSERVAQIELYVDTENARAIAFYEHRGFLWVATHLDTVRINGISKDDHVYRLVL